MSIGDWATMGLVGSLLAALAVLRDWRDRPSVAAYRFPR